MYSQNKKKKTFKYRDFNEPHRIEFEYEIIKICLGIHLFIFMSLVRFRLETQGTY